MKCQTEKKTKNNYKGGQSSHLYDRVMYLKETAQELNENHKDFLARLKADKFSCPMGWIRAQLVGADNERRISGVLDG